MNSYIRCEGIRDGFLEAVLLELMLKGKIESTRRGIMGESYSCWKEERVQWRGGMKQQEAVGNCPSFITSECGAQEGPWMLRLNSCPISSLKPAELPQPYHIPLL